MGICGIYIVSAKLLSPICEVRECWERQLEWVPNICANWLISVFLVHGMCLFVVVVLPFGIRGSLPLVSWWPYLNVSSLSLSCPWHLLLVHVHDLDLLYYKQWTNYLVVFSDLNSEKSVKRLLKFISKDNSMQIWEVDSLGNFFRYFCHFYWHLNWQCIFSSTKFNLF